MQEEHHFKEHIKIIFAVYGAHWGEKEYDSEKS